MRNPRGESNPAVYSFMLFILFRLCQASILEMRLDGLTNSVLPIIWEVMNDPGAHQVRLQQTPCQELIYIPILITD